MKELYDYIMDEDNYINSYNLSIKFFNTGNLSAALTYFLKTAESDNVTCDIKYDSLCYISKIYQIAGERWRGAIQYARFAKSENPNRPEAYLLLCEIISNMLWYNRINEQDEWIQVFENSNIGLSLTDNAEADKSIIYGGREKLLFYKAISLFRLNKLIDLKEFLNSTKFTEIDNPEFINQIIDIYNILRIRCPYTTYDSEVLDKVKIKFKNIENIKSNYSQAMQDMFVLTALNGKKNGTYLEIGAGDPLYGNNTKLLEEFGWKGLSIDWSNEFIDDFICKRTNPIIQRDALSINYDKLISKYYNTNTIDYLSLDIDPSENTLYCLYNLPLDNVIFNVVTFEHDSYADGDNSKNKANELLTKNGYILIGENIKYNLTDSFEDWYVHKSILNPENESNLKKIFSNSNGLIKNYFLK